MARKQQRNSPTGGPELPRGEIPIDSGTAEIITDPDHSGRVTLNVNGVPSSFLDLTDPGFLAFEYMQQMDAVVTALLPGPLRALHLGAAGCALARAWDANHPGSKQLAVDIDAALVTLVRQWFDLPRAPRLRLRAEDALAALAGAYPGSYHVIVRDVFSGAKTPSHLVNLATAQAAAKALRPGGVYLANCGDRPPLTEARREMATLAAGFGTDNLALIAEPGVLKGRRYGNLVLVAVSSPEPSLANPALARALRALPVPATILTGQELTAFVGTAAPFA